MSAVRPLNVLCATTRQWNPGDEWIAAGIRKLMSAVLPGRAINWILYDRSPMAFVSPWISSERSKAWLGNSYWGQGTLEPDLIITAGTPEWAGPHLQTLFERHANAKWLFLGIGGGEAPPQLHGYERDVLGRAFIVTRDLTTAEALRASGIECRTMPCPALFAADTEASPRQLHRIAVVLQGDRVPNQAVSSELKAGLEALIPRLSERWDVDVVCNYIDEFLEYSRTLTVSVRYHYDAAEYERVLFDYDLVVTSRLHSAILANSLLKPAIVVNPSKRIESAVALFPHIERCGAEDVIARMEAMDFQPSVRQLFNWKRRTEDEYLRLLREGLSQHGLD